MLVTILLRNGLTDFYEILYAYSVIQVDPEACEIQEPKELKYKSSNKNMLMRRVSMAQLRQEQSEDTQAERNEVIRL